MRLVAVCVVALACLGAHASDRGQRTLTFEDRVAAQQAIEQVYWSHRTWPRENRQPKPPLSTVLPDDAIRARVEDYLRKSNALDTLWHRPITGYQLQAEIDRMARGSRDRRLLQQLFDALQGDAFVIAETLARPILADRLARTWLVKDERSGVASGPELSFDAWWASERAKHGIDLATSSRPFVLPAFDASGCTNDTWSPTFTDVPDGRYNHTALWTGTEMIVWGGNGGDSGDLNTGGRYNPATDTWTATSTGAHVPYPREGHTVVWTGTEMIVWGGKFYGAGGSIPPYLNDGGRYDPINDAWLPTSTGANVPAGRMSHTSVWTGTEMIVWGGVWNDPLNLRISGGRYNPVSDAWLPTAIGANVPSGRTLFSVVWTGTEMIVWGGVDYWSGRETNTGARYSPSADSWTPTPTSANVPSARTNHSAVWTGTEMIVWGGQPYAVGGGTSPYFKSGGRYSPSTNSWSTTSTGAGVPSPRFKHSAFWMGSKMLVWGGSDDGGSSTTSTGAIYDPVTDSWTATPASPFQPTSAFYRCSAVWSGTEMIVWGGQVGGFFVPSGSRFDPATGSWVATSVATNVAESRLWHTAIWTGTEMIVWGGARASAFSDPAATLNSGSRYVPATDSWIQTSTIGGVPTSRRRHAAVWTGTEMIVWGGYDGSALQTGGRYNPVTDRWTATSTGTNAPAPHSAPAAVWTGTEMIIWGFEPSGGRYDPATDTWATISAGANAPSGSGTQTALWTGRTMLYWSIGGGGRYDPSIDAWTAISAGANAPLHRFSFTSIWTGTEMIVWGGNIAGSGGGITNTGARYDPVSDTWMPTSTGANVPTPRSDHTAVWTGSEMVVWGADLSGPMIPGGRYSPATNSWTTTSAAGSVATPREYHTAVWTGSEMIVWGGLPGTVTGGRYCACPSGHLVYRDADGDGYGDPGQSIPSCDGTAPAGYVTDSTDCDDTNAAVHPGAVDTCNGIDDNCNGVIDEGGPALCDDSNVCTDDACDGVAGCGHTNNSAACDDGRACTNSDTCFLGVCGGIPLSGAPCDDGNACTTGDVCGGGTCNPGTPVVCNDNNICTTDTCNPATGCVFTNNTNPCDDGNACTTGDACAGGVCVGTAVTAPPETQSLTVAADKSTYSWSAATDATQYDVVRGGMGAFPVGPSGDDETCFDNLAGTKVVDSALPVPGTGYWYLSRGENACGIGTWGTGSNGSPRMTTTCP